jgi:hypothetical protein
LGTIRGVPGARGAMRARSPTVAALAESSFELFGALSNFSASPNWGNLGLRFGGASILTSSGAALATFPAQQASDHSDNIQNYSAELSRGAPKFQADRSSRAFPRARESLGPSIPPYLGMGLRLERSTGAHTAQVQQLLSPPKRKVSAVDFHHGGSRGRPRMLDSDEGGVASGHIIGV